VANALWRFLLSVRRSEGVGEGDERGWRSIMGSEEKDVVMVRMGMAGRYLGTLSLRRNDSFWQSETAAYMAFRWLPAVRGPW
jgi:hypothetical protein